MERINNLDSVSLQLKALTYDQSNVCAYPKETTLEFGYKCFFTKNITITIGDQAHSIDHDQLKAVLKMFDDILSAKKIEELRKSSLRK